MFFEKTGPVWDTLHALERRLHDADIDYVVIGGFAVHAHRHVRQTVDVDIVLTRDGLEKFKREFVGRVYEHTTGAPRRYLDPDTDVTIDILIADELAGHRKKNDHVRFPDPGEAEEHGGLRTVSLARLIELKLVTWRYEDWGDVVRLIRENHLDELFAEQLDPLVRTAYLQCYDQSNDPDYGPM